VSARDVEARYLDGSYLEANPEWDRGDSSWKAGLVASALEHCRIVPTSICDIGCGAGDVLRELRSRYPRSRLTGYDISPNLKIFWEDNPDGIEFVVGDAPAAESQVMDVVLLLDVIEHLRDPFQFLAQARRAGRWFVFHIPLDLSALAVMRESPLLLVREKVGHVHYFTRALAMSLLAETGFEVVYWRYTGAALLAPRRSLKTRLAAIPRRVVYAVSHDLGARLLGGETLLVVAKPVG
jgi:SAM-dependent methyltransferase